MSFAARTPWILYGTAWKEDATEACVRLALEAGFRGIDTANQRKHYVEAGVGAALGPFIAAHGRESVFVQTKFTYREVRITASPTIRRRRPPSK
jgi:diketogulonate reductase-like aldo/keto reductase